MNSINQSTPNEFNDELLSAYLDDELSTEERALVEKHIATNADAKQLVDELRTLSASLQSLPKQTLDTTSSETILKAVAARHVAFVPKGKSNEHDLAARQEKTSVYNSSKSEEDNSAVPFNVGRSKRGWAWSMMAIAAALLLMFFQGEWQLNPQDLAKNEEVINVCEERNKKRCCSFSRRKKRHNSRHGS